MVLGAHTRRGAEAGTGGDERPGGGGPDGGGTEEGGRGAAGGDTEERHFFSFCFVFGRTEGSDGRFVHAEGKGSRREKRSGR